MTRALEGPLELDEYEGADGSPAATTACRASARSPSPRRIRLGRSSSATEDVPVEVTLQAFNPLVPADVDASSLPVAVLRYVLTNRSDQTPCRRRCAARCPTSSAMDGSLTRARICRRRWCPSAAKPTATSFHQRRRAAGHLT